MTLLYYIIITSIFLGFNLRIYTVGIIVERATENRVIKYMSRASVAEIVTLYSSITSCWLKSEPRYVPNSLSEIF